MNKQEIEKAIDYFKNAHIDYSNVESGVIAERVCNLAISALTQQLNNGWIPVSEPPTEYGTYIVAWMPTGHTSNDVMKATKSELTHYYEMLEYNPEEDEEWETITQYDSYKIIAWRNLPESYKEVSE